MSAHGKSGFGSGMFGKESQSYEVYLNLTPLMDVMSNILFFLLAAFGTSIVAVLPATVPVQSSEESSIEKADDKVTVTLQANDAGLSLTCESQTLGRAELKQYETRIPKSGKEFDKQMLEALTAALKRIKERYPGSNSMILVPDDAIRYEEVVKIMDASREIKLADNRRITLFAEVVLSGIYGAESDKAKKPRR